MMKIKYYIAVAAAMMIGVNASSYTDSSFQEAMSLYEKGQYTQARALFEKLGEDSQAKGYAALCAAKAKSEDYKLVVNGFLARYPYSGLDNQINFQKALNLFDEQDYSTALELLEIVDKKKIDKAEEIEYLFKRAYCYFETGNYDAAVNFYQMVEKQPFNTYTSPSRYSLGYINYERRNFRKALEYFELSSTDPRFKEISSYYILECYFMLKDYDFVVKNGPEIYDMIPEERKPHLARLISEAFLVKGDTASAKKYFDQVNAGIETKSRGDLFYSGSLLYALKDYNGAQEYYSRMPEKVDSIGQIANYQLGYCYIQTKNKVAALTAFKNASDYAYSPKIQEDAFFNYAKLAFDLNNDSSVFDRYIEKYSDRVKGAQIYSYQAVAALYKNDFAGAVNAYDKIEHLSEDMVNNYMKANYLRANQLIKEGSFRNAVPCLKAAAYYSNKQSGINQLSRYWLAETYYRDDMFSEARSIYTDLYNISALDRREEGAVLPFNIAYCYFKENNFAQSSKWFDIYLNSRDKGLRKDALTRKADGLFIEKNYSKAADAYAAALYEFPERDDLYAYYQGAISYGLAGNNTKKVELLSKIVSVSPEVPFWSESIYELGHTYTVLKQDDKAETCYKSLLAGAKDKNYQALALIGLGMTARNASKYDEAIAYYKQVVEQMPSTEYADAALLALEVIYQNRQEPEKYLEYIDSHGQTGNKSEADREVMIFNAAEQVFLSENYSKALSSLQSYESAYPQGQFIKDVWFYMAECLKNLDKKEQACDYYKKVIESAEGSFAEAAAVGYSSLSYSLNNYKDAYEGYLTLQKIAKFDVNKHSAALGLMRSAYNDKEYATAIEDSKAVLADTVSTAAEIREAKYIQAKSLLSTSQRDKAFVIIKELAKEPKTAQGAEAAYLSIVDAYDQGNFTDVENKVFSFADSGTGQTYWLAKAFIVLGDSYAERDDFRQAKATFESVRDGYTPKDMNDDVLGSVNMRLEKLSKIQGAE